MKQNSPENRKQKLFKQLYIIGITGGVGAGKSSVLAVIRDRYQGWVIQADEVGHRLRKPGKPIHQWMVREYGEAVLFGDGTINPRAVAALAFRDEEAMKRLNGATHPLIREEILRELKEKEASLPEGTVGVVALEAALLKEGNLSGLCDEIWYIHAPKETRISRLMESRGYTRERCGEIMSRQADEETFLREADLVIENGSSVHKMEEQISRRLKTVLQEQKENT